MGFVKKFGPRGIRGWAKQQQDRSNLVELYLNGSCINRTGLSTPLQVNGEGDVHAFSMQVTAAWEYLGAGDTLEVRHNERSLPIAKWGSAYIHQCETLSRADELIGLVERGYIFNKRGQLRLQLVKNDKWKRSVFSLFDRLQADVRERFGYELTITYGTLLGCIREQTFIEHDDDFDVAYVSRFKTPIAVVDEFFDLCSMLVEKGYRIRLGQNNNLVKVAAHKGRPIDVFYAWYSEQGEFQISYGYHGQEAIKDWKAGTYEDALLDGVQVRVPANSEALLRQMYGDSWRVPQQGFSHYASTRKIDKRYFLDSRRAQQLYWSQFYRDSELSEPSFFAEFIAEHIPVQAMIIDIGCGNGRDSVYFAERGYQVAGCDLSSQAISRGQRMAAELRLDRCAFSVADVAASNSLQSFLCNANSAAGSEGKPTVVYCRFFIHSISLEAECVLWESLCTTLEPGFTLALEFRTDQDKDREKAIATAHYRRFVNPDDLIERLVECYRFEILMRKEGFGLSPFRGEDPHLCRLIARKL